MSADQNRYASEIVHTMHTKHGVPRDRAVGLVQGAAPFIRKQHGAKVPASYVARRLASGHTTGQGVNGKKGAAPAKRVGHSSGDEPRGRVVESKYGWNLDSLRDLANRRQRGAGVGHSSGESAINANKIVCVSDSWSPSLFVPSSDHGELSREVIKVDAETRKLFVTARGARSPKELQTLQAKIDATIAKGKTPTGKQTAKAGELRIKAARIMDAQDRVAVIMTAKDSVIATNKDATTWMSGGAMMVEGSGNDKIKGRAVDTTYASVEHTCPKSCAQRGVACYGETSNNIGPIVQMLEHVANVLNRSPEQVAEDEARAIDAAYSFGISQPTDFRIHTVGDARSRHSVRMLAAAAYRWKKKAFWTQTVAAKNHPGPVAWTYTHGWYEHSREDWAIVSCLASAQTPSGAIEAKRRGWATAIVVPSDFFKKRPSFDPATGEPIGFQLEGIPITYLPCPAQNPDESKQVGCTNCRLCLDDRDLYKKGFGIAFVGHSSGGIRGVPMRHPAFRDDPGLQQKLPKRRLTVVG